MAVEQGAWPDRAGYLSLVQVPGNFADDDLRGATLTSSRFGGPQVWSGARAMVFQARTVDQRLLAVRVFLTAQAADQTRYAALNRHLEQRSVPTFVWTRWVDEGLAFGSHRVPLIKMPWVDGVPLDDYLAACLAKPRPGPELDHMAEEWRRACQMLTSSDLAHGDIHAQNVLVCPGDAPGRVRYQLVDYDGVWVPSLSTAPNEIGNRAYQHPDHDTSHWGRDVDAFPTTLVYLSLRALAAEPELWDRHHTDDTLLFQYQDLAHPQSSSVWGALAASSEDFVRSLTAVVIRWLGERPDAMRSLEDAVAAASSTQLPLWPKPTAATGKPNVWPPRPDPATSTGRQPWGPPRAAEQPPAAWETGPVRHQHWPGSKPKHDFPGSPSAKAGTSHQWVWVLVVAVAVVVIIVLFAAA